MIDKTIPNRLQADADQRLVRPEVGEMLDAQNVTMAESGGSSAGVIKNVRGTVPGTPLSASDDIADSNEVTVIGSVSDSQRGYIYWFVADNSGNTQHAIYQYNTSDNTYRTVFKGQYLDFDPSGFVKAEIVNAAFQQDGVVQSVLYFTDNDNPPRKINVDRAIAGDYDSILGINKDYAFNLIKAAPTRVPSASFSTDSAVNQNNFTTLAVQFATQFIYVDGEESAISGYSKLTAPDVASVVGLDAVNIGKLYYEDNVCDINTRFSYSSGPSALANNATIPDVEKLRILVREGNNGAWTIVDEVDVDQHLERDVYGNTIQVYNRDTGIYKWYNEGVNAALSNVDANKLYDNVPFQAQGLSVAGNRVMLSNYTEGRENHDPGASISVSYNESRDPGTNLSGASPITWDNATPSNGGTIEINFLGVGAFTNATDVIPSGSRTVISFEFDAIGSFYKSTDHALIITGQEDGEQVQYGFGDSGNTLPLENSSNLVFNLIVENENDITVADLPGLVEGEIQGMSLLKQFDLTSSITADVISGTTLVIGSGTGCTAVVRFDDITVNDTGGNANVEIRPYVSTFFFNDIVDTTIGGTLITNQDFYPATTDEQSDHEYNYDASLVTSPAISSTAFVAEKSWKAGATHELGIVYYDKYNRSGNVNRIGGFYVDHFSERTSPDYGSASVTVSFSEDAPTWAERYQFVYPGNSTYSSWNTYTVGGGFFEYSDYGGSTQNPPSDPNEGKKLVYVSLNTLEEAKKEKGFLNDYSFTEGDKLRVISYDSVATGTGTPSIVHPAASDGSPIEFNVLGYRYIDIGDQSRFHSQNQHTEGNPVIDEHYGWFLVLDAPAVNGGITGSNGADIKYPGFDWFSISNTSYPDTAASSNNNYWGQRCLVEILTPRKKSSETVWYEIGEEYAVGTRKGGLTSPTNHGPSVTLGGAEVFFRPISCGTPFRSATADYDLHTDKYRYENINAESQRISDYFGDESWDKGRAHVVFEESATIRRFNGITYSDAYAEDVANLSLSSFNASLANFFSLDSANGACNYIGTLRDDYLLAVQENRVSRVPIGKDIITSPNTSGIVSLSTNVLSSPFYYVGDFGCGNNPESVYVRDGNAFFFDASRKKIVRLTGEGVSPISENGVDSLVKDQYDLFSAQGGTRVVSGYDPEDNQYYVTFRPSGTFNGLTLGYNVGGNVWQSRYTFFPDMYADQNGSMYSALYVDPEEGDTTVFYSHTNDTERNTFYGTSAPSVVRVASNYNPSMVKVFNAVSLEGDSGGWVADPVVTDLNSNGQSLGFVEREGSYYSAFTRDENGAKHITGIGVVDSASSTGDQITFENKVNRNPIPYGSVIKLIDSTNDEYDDIGFAAAEVTFVKFVDAYTIEVAGALVNISLNGLVGGDLVAVSDAQINGDPIRGHWADITLTNNQTTPFELFCVNTHFSDSKLNHALGQQ